DPVEIVGAALLVLRLLEEGQDPVPIPALAAALPPIVVIRRGAAHVDHAVDRAGAPQDLAARLVKGAAVQLRLRLALEHPTDPRAGVGLGVAERDVNPRVTVDAAGFEDQHPVLARLAEPRGDRAAGRPGPGDDEIVSLTRTVHPLPPTLLRLRPAPTIAKAERYGKRANQPSHACQGPWCSEAAACRGCFTSPRIAI